MQSGIKYKMSCLFILATATFQLFAQAQKAHDPVLMPIPAQLQIESGQLAIDGSFSVALKGYKEPRLDAAMARFFTTLAHETGIPFKKDEASSEAILTVHTGAASKVIQQLGEDESYRLEVTTDHATLTAPNPLGVLRGLQTFLQLVHVTPTGFAVPAVTIDDRPRFPWRGLMLDSGRHFMPLDVIERNLDGMEAVKLNVFHWHLSENQGFRVESKVFPLLQKKGSDDLYYTQSEVKRRHSVRPRPRYSRCARIRCSVPYHCVVRWLPASWRAAKGPIKIERHWGVMDPAMDPSRETTYQFLDRFFGEMAALFPDAYFHIGGDECNGKEWDANQRIQAFMHAHHLKDNAALQSYFSGRVQKLVAGHHKIMEGWDEVLQPDTPKDVVIQSWRGPKALAAAARQGNRGILSTGYYVDLNQSAAEHYLADPTGGRCRVALRRKRRARILGGEATMWSEFVTPENIDSRIWPRTAAIAERLWSPQEVSDVDSMYARLADNLRLAAELWPAPHFFTERYARAHDGDPDPHALALFLAHCSRHEIRTWSRKGIHSATPLNRLVDAIPPESETARNLAEDIKAIVAGSASREQWEGARHHLTVWRDNDAKLQPELPKSDLTAELAPVSQSVSEVAGIGLAALDALENHHELDSATTAANLSMLKGAEKPQAALRNMLVSPSSSSCRLRARTSSTNQETILVRPTQNGPRGPG